MRRVPWWVWASAIPLGLGAWTPIVPGRELRRRGWIGFGILWTLLTVAGWVLASDSNGDNGAAGGLVIAGWVGAIATCLTIRSTYLKETRSTWVTAREAAEERLRRRKEAQELAQRDPALALELGVGRPDWPGAQDGGVVDVNHAPVSVLRELPGVTLTQARRIAKVRAEIDGFDSVEDLGEMTDLDADAVERLRGHTVFLPY